MVKLHPSVLERDGKKAFVVLPYEEFVMLEEEIESFEDLKDVAGREVGRGRRPDQPVIGGKEGIGTLIDGQEKGGNRMTTLSAVEASKRLPELLDNLAEFHDVVQIAGSQHRAMLVSGTTGGRFKKRSISPRFRG